MTDPTATSVPPVSPDELYDRAPCGLLTLTEAGRIVRVNATFSAWTGITPEQLTGTPLSDLLEPGARIFYETRFVPILHLEGEVREVALAFRTTRDAALPVLVNAAVDRGGATPLVHVAVFDASRRQDYERQLLTARRIAESSEARTRVLQNATTAFGESETVERLAQALAESAREALGAAAAAVFLDDHHPRVAGGTVPLDPDLLPGGVPPEALAADGILTWTVRDGQQHPDAASALRAARLDTILTVPLLQAGTPIGTLACYFSRPPELDDHATDLLRSLCRQAAQTVARLRLQAQLAAIALHDPLTGLANRVLLRTHIAASVTAAIERQEPLALIFVDLDDFKAVNDDLDHTAGDTVLKLIAARLSSAVRGDDLVCRYGGDEFIIVCRDTDHERAAAIAERIRVAIKQPLHDDGWTRTITASVGVTVHTPGHSRVLDGPELLRVADKAMYRSKDRGKDQVSVIAL
ncbi:diguanylate cyclase [Leifsonia shinshuensis]|uniref:diguanylate cyclase n=1 Tax=Leifsonia shinshuensis TaxID=150026 RepID=UPI00285F65A8|nr:diguanylate cyclase [Leifsonia shinshuensis]MDR6970187.1 diguanylate cyclase (GGDEF)-like protein/PAS domain S-box-containing protein [Leifsonia shinshuensis]